MENVKIYLTNLNESETQRIGMTQNQLFFIEILCKQLKLENEFKKYIIPNGYDNAYSKLTRINAGLLIDALKNKNSVELIEDSPIEYQHFNKYGGNVDISEAIIPKVKIAKTIDNSIKLDNPDDIITNAELKILKILEKMRNKQGKITKD